MTPGTARTAALTSLVMVSFIGQPDTVSRTVTRTTPGPSTSTDSTIPRSVMGRLISGSITVPRAVETWSRRGVLMMLQG